MVKNYELKDARGSEFLQLPCENSSLQQLEMVRFLASIPSNRTSTVHTHEDSNKNLQEQWRILMQ
jgi:hypothetical protein